MATPGGGKAVVASAQSEHAGVLPGECRML
jgi:hypothetical protein